MAEPGQFQNRRLRLLAGTLLLGLSVLVVVSLALLTGVRGPFWMPVSSMESNELLSVACASPTDCLSVGFSIDGDHYRPLVEHWDGAEWNISPGQLPLIGMGTKLFGVACPSTAHCFIVGANIMHGHREHLLIAQWNGVSFGSMPYALPVGAASSALRGISCASEQYCVAVGYYCSSKCVSSTPVEQPMSEFWDGTAWTWAVASATSAQQFNGLYGVGCGRTRSCIAVGWSTSTVDQTLAETHTSGRWRLSSTPNTSSAQNNDLYGIACTSRSQCFAVGYYSDAAGTFYGTLVLQWDGSHWFIAEPSSGVALVPSALLSGVTCLTKPECLAVGTYCRHHCNVGGDGYRTLIEVWRGRTWKLESSPNIGSQQFNALDAISCAGASMCMAVGYYRDGIPSQTLTEVWNGATWKVIRSPSVQGFSGVQR